MCLRACYAVSGTDFGCVCYYQVPLYFLAARTHFLSGLLFFAEPAHHGTDLRNHYGMSGAAKAYGTTRRENLCAFCAGIMRFAVDFCTWLASRRAWDPDVGVFLGWVPRIRAWHD
eukprot:1458395-Rhodomonas_salina.2